VKKFRDIQIIHHIQGLFEQSWCIVYFGETSRNYDQSYNKSNVIIDKKLLSKIKGIKQQELHYYLYTYNLKIFWVIDERRKSHTVRYTQNNLVSNPGILNNEYTYRKYTYLSKNTILVFNFRNSWCLIYTTFYL